MPIVQANILYNKIRSFISNIQKISFACMGMMTETLDFRICYSTEGNESHLANELIVCKLGLFRK